MKNLYSKIDIKYLEKIYFTQVRKNTKNKRKLFKFEEFYTINMIDTLNKLDNYKIDKYNIFLIREPKVRVIMSLNIKDKIINHAIGNILINILEPSLINTNVATRKEKGTHYGIRYIKKYINELKEKEVFALKFDISKYFYNIDHDVLKKLISKKIKDKKFLNVLFSIIDSTDEDYINKKINLLNEDVPIYKKGKGLPIGNLTSQIMAVFYLNELDHFIVEKLKLKYVRYMDDGVLLSNDKNYLKYALKEIKKIIKKYKLEFNDKTKIININKEGLDFLGFRFYIINNKIVMKVRNSTKKKFKRAKDENSIKSYYAHLKWGNCFNLMKKYSLKN